MHLARQGGSKSETKILPADVDGFTQGPRLSLADHGAQYVPKPTQEARYRPKIPRPKGEGESKAIGVIRLVPDSTAIPNLSGSGGIGSPNRAIRMPSQPLVGRQVGRWLIPNLRA